MSSGKGGVDSKPIGGFKSAMAKYQNTASSGDAGTKPAPKKAATSSSSSSSSSSSGGGGGNNALFASINSGGLTKGLNKVTADMKTKNRDPKDKSGKVPTNIKKTGTAKSKKAGTSEKKEEAVKDPEIKKMGNSIRVSYYKNMSKLMVFGSAADDPNEKIEDPYTPEDMKMYDGNTLDLKIEMTIWNCDSAMFRFSKKCKAIKLYNCKNVQISVKSVVSTIEVTNCQKVSLFVKEKAPSIILEKCDGIKVWLDEAAAAADPPPQLYTTLTQNTELSVSQGNDKDPLDVPVPSQFVTQIQDGKWKTSPVEHV